MFYIAKLHPLRQSKVIKILKKNGFKKAREGRHIVFKKTKPNGKILTTYVPRHREVTIFVLQYIIKQTEKSREEFY